jgi:hypothetical protein
MPLKVSGGWVLKDGIVSVLMSSGHLDIHYFLLLTPAGD